MKQETTLEEIAERFYGEEEIVNDYNIQLSWINQQGIKFRIDISLDSKYLLNIKKFLLT
jgi:hypothetical protein